MSSNCFLKTVSADGRVSWDTGSEFNTDGPATEKARLAKLKVTSLLKSYWVSKLYIIWKILDCFRGESIQAISWTGTDSRTRKVPGKVHQYKYAKNK